MGSLPLVDSTTGFMKIKRVGYATPIKFSVFSYLFYSGMALFFQAV